MKEITIHCTWRSDHTVEVPDDFEVTGNLSDFPEDVLEQLTLLTAELVDWK
jgi:hypothetical protein